MRTVNGLWLKQLREDAGLTQRQFGIRVHKSSPYLSDIERNRRECPERIYEAYRNLERKPK